MISSHSGKGLIENNEAAPKEALFTGKFRQKYYLLHVNDIHIKTIGKLLLVFN